MDLVIRFWSNQKEQIVSKYFGSSFLGHSTVADLLVAFEEKLQYFDLRRLLHFSMDGPNVNVKFLWELKEELGQDSDGGPVNLEFLVLVVYIV